MKKSLLLSLIAVAVVAIVAPQAAVAGTMTLDSVTDVWIREIGPDTTFENDLVSVWAAGAEAGARNSALMFDLSGVTDEIVGAYLSLYELDNWHNASVFSQQASNMVPTDVSGLTWNTLGNFTIRPFESLGAYDMDGTETKAVYQDSDAASAADVAVLEAIRLAGGSVSMLLTPTEEGEREWGDTGYSSTPPHLVLITAAVPEPGTIALLLIGMVSLLVIRRK